VVYRETGEPKGIKVSEGPWDKLAPQEEPSVNEDQRDHRGLLESLASQEYLAFLEEQESWGRLVDQERR